MIEQFCLNQTSTTTPRKSEPESNGEVPELEPHHQM